MIRKIKKIAVALGCAIAIAGGGGAYLSSCTLEPSTDSPSGKRADLPPGMPPELAVYGPIITMNGSTRVIRYTVEVGTSASLEYTSQSSGGFSDGGTIDSVPAQSVAALMLQYGTQASKLPASAAVSTSLFSTGIDSVVASGSVALKDPTFVIIPLQTDVIREHLGIALISSGAGTASSIMWIENNTGETMPADAWGAGTYAANGIRIGGLNSAGSSSSTVTDFDNGIAAENHPRSLATVLYTGQTSTINFYNPNAIGNDTIIKVTDNVGSLQAANGQTVKTWLENKNPLPTPPAVSVIYKWKEN